MRNITLFGGYRVVIGFISLVVMVALFVVGWKISDKLVSVSEQDRTNLANQSAQRGSSKSPSPVHSTPSDYSTANKPRTEPPDEQNKQDEERRSARFLGWLNSLETDNQIQDVAQLNSDSMDVEKQKRAKVKKDEATQLGREHEIESARQQIIDTVTAKAEVLRWLRYATGKEDPLVAQRYRIAHLELGHQLLSIDVPNYINLTRDIDAVSRGGWIYELCIENGFTIGPDPYEAVRRDRSQ